MSVPVILPEKFPEFFENLWGYPPFPWQEAFAQSLCSGETPKYVTVPTGSGKTACLDAAVFALAVQSSRPISQRVQGRRIFFVVNRRVIVDEAFERAGCIAKKLASAKAPSVCADVAEALRSLSSDASELPLQHTRLRGGIYQQQTWVRSPLQPTIICSTIDQVGSRLLFRGYGVSEEARPIHAALVAQDSMLIIDEAHISRPFLQTLDWIEQYRRFPRNGRVPICLPFQVVQMTATPPTDDPTGRRIDISTADRSHQILGARLRSEKSIKLVYEEKAKGKSCLERLVMRLVEETSQIIESRQPRSIAVMVNRVLTARKVADALREKYGKATLFIGRMRDLDRDAITKHVCDRLKTGSAPEDGLEIVVSTQCLEVGADLDFDAIVTEAASLDALRQRFGRLNRAGRPIEARGSIVFPAAQDISEEKLDDSSPCDAVYGNAIPRTWRWLKGLAIEDVVDFGIDALTSHVRTLDPQTLEKMIAPSPDAPILLPAYLDCWVQTSPSPAADPEVGIFLHGPQRATTDIQVCWRADLPNSENQQFWIETLALCPPTSIECLPVPLHTFTAWMSSLGQFEDTSSDALEFREPIDNRNQKQPNKFPFLLWKGPRESKLLKDTSDLKAGDTIVLRTQDGGWCELGEIPHAPMDPLSNQLDRELDQFEMRKVDVAETANLQSRGRAILRLHRNIWIFDTSDASRELEEIVDGHKTDWSNDDFIRFLREIAKQPEGPNHPFADIAAHLSELSSRQLKVLMYPDSSGIVLTSNVRMTLKSNPEISTGLEEGSDALLESPSPKSLDEHTEDVLTYLHSYLDKLPLSEWENALISAATLHDWGKADARFQAMLRGTSLFAAMASDLLLAKSQAVDMNSRRASRDISELPVGFRHEMLSLQMAQTPDSASILPEDEEQVDLALHLISSHHGRGRPFAPVVQDETPTGISFDGPSGTISINSEIRRLHPAHSIDSGIADRFWRLTRQNGWWGLAFLETVLRLSDQNASAMLQEGHEK